MYGYIAAGILLVCLAITIFSHDGTTSSTKTASSKCHGQTAALSISQKFVKDRLKAPTTAKFPWRLDAYNISSDQVTCTYSIVGYVDSQNSFGAQIRSNWEVLVRWQPEKETWHLDYITIQ